MTFLRLSLLLLAAVASGGPALAFDAARHGSSTWVAGEPRLRAGAAVSAPRGYGARHHGGHAAYGTHGRGGYRTAHPSVSHWPTPVPGNARYGTSGTGGIGSIVVIHTGAAAGDAEDRSIGLETRSARVIDVASARLDRRPFDGERLDVTRVGTAKVIRIAPDAGRRAGKDEVDLPELDGGFAALTPAERAVRVYPDLDAAPEDPPEIVPVPEAAPPVAAEPVPDTATLRPSVGLEREDGAPVFEPWTPDWLRDCVARHPTFDASLGTYTDEAGRRRFCTGSVAD